MPPRPPSPAKGPPRRTGRRCRSGQQANKVARAQRRLADLRAHVPAERKIPGVGNGRYSHMTRLRQRPPGPVSMGRIRKDSALFHPSHAQPATGRSPLCGKDPVQGGHRALGVSAASGQQAALSPAGLSPLHRSDAGRRPAGARVSLWRGDVEVNFREEKPLLGVGQAQLRGPASVEAVPPLAVGAYALLQLRYESWAAALRPESLAGFKPQRSPDTKPE